MATSQPVGAQLCQFRDAVLCCALQLIPTEKIRRSELLVREIIIKLCKVETKMISAVIMAQAVVPKGPKKKLGKRK